MPQEELRNPCCMNTSLNANYMELRRAETNRIWQVWNNCSFPVFHARRNLRHDDIAGEKRGVALLDLTVRTNLRLSQATSFRRYSSHWNEVYFARIVFNVKYSAGVDLGYVS